jgi:hypothetical protein
MMCNALYCPFHKMSSQSLFSHMFQPQIQEMWMEIEYWLANGKIYINAKGYIKDILISTYTDGEDDIINYFSGNKVMAESFKVMIKQIIVNYNLSDPAMIMHLQSHGISITHAQLLLRAQKYDTQWGIQ